MHIQPPRLRIGVLALQGAFQLHQFHLEQWGVEYVEVIDANDLSGIAGLILPGGESSTMLKLIHTMGLNDLLRNFFQTRPTWGICAGAILLAKKVTCPSQESFGAIDIEIERNGYGRQLDSTEDHIDGYPVSYIRAPIITQVGEQTSILAKRGLFPVWVENQTTMVTTFHPEIHRQTPSPWHLRFIEKCQHASF